VLALVLVAAGCGGGNWRNGPSDASSDRGTTADVRAPDLRPDARDLGTDTDATDATDAGMDADAGHEDAAGPRGDAGPSADAGGTPDVRIDLGVDVGTKDAPTEVFVPRCVAGGCNDRDPCTLDHCVPEIGCQHPAAAPDTSCSDGNACNGAETCQSGVCKPGPALKCDDANPCTVDGCAAASGCTHGWVLSGTSCSDGNVCNGAETCQSGVCKPSPAPSCDDTNLCTADSCEPAIGCKYVAISPAEVCGDGLDNDCDGRIDEGCGCAGVGPGAGGSIDLADAESVTKLVADRGRCRLYALVATVPAQVVVIDADARQELARLKLTMRATDIDLSPNGKWLAVSEPELQKIAVIDPDTLTPSIISTLDAAQVIEATDDGKAYYYPTQGSMHRIDLTTGLNSDLALPSPHLIQADLEASPDGQMIATGSTVTMKFSFVRSSGVPGPSPRNWLNPFGGSGGVYVSPGGQHVYYGLRQVRLGSADDIVATSAEVILAENLAGTIAVGRTTVFDAQLTRPLKPLPRPVRLATFLASDHEVWTIEGGVAKVFYASVGGLVAGVPLGQRAFKPVQPYPELHVRRLLHDAARKRVYGLNIAESEIVAFDDQTLLPVAAVHTATAPASMDFDSTGKYLLVGHTQSLVLLKIDLDTFSAPTTPTTFSYRYLTALRARNLPADRFVSVGTDGASTASYLDMLDATGGLLFELGSFRLRGVADLTADGKSVFFGDGGMNDAQVFRYSIGATAFTQIASSLPPRGFPYSAAALRSTKDGNTIFYGQSAIDGNDLRTVRYPIGYPIFSLTPDDRLAISESTVYRAADGAVLGLLPYSGFAQAVSEDGKRLFIVSPVGLRVVDLSAY
jgi:hypothetical protein